jgi:3-oxoacyl-[acyl-carrier protein] reductase
MSLANDRVALVTGSSRGIGAAIARRLGQAGARVIVHANKSAEDAERVSREISPDASRAAVIQGDLASDDGPKQVVDRAFRKFGALDILVNNAAVFEGGSVDELSAEQIDRVLAVNIRSVFLTTKEFVLVTKSENGRIVNISSIAGHLPSPGGSLYAASKAAVESLTKSLAVELGQRKITVNAVAPGTTETEMSLHGFPSELLTLNAAVTPLGGLGRPDQVAEAVALLCSGSAGWITGQVLAADGGQLTTMAVLRRIQDAVERQWRQKAA